MSRRVISDLLFKISNYFIERRGGGYFGQKYILFAHFEIK